MGILEVGLSGRKKAVSKLDRQSIAQMKKIIAAQNRKRTSVQSSFMKYYFDDECVKQVVTDTSRTKLAHSPLQEMETEQKLL